jgi:hypothetical protein
MARTYSCRAFAPEPSFIEQHFVLDREQLAATLRQMRLQGWLVRE